MKKFLISFFLAFSIFLVPRSVSAGSISIDSSFEPSFISDSSFPLNLIDSSLQPAIGIVAGDRAVVLTGNRFVVDSDYSFSITVDGSRLYVNGARFDNYDFYFSNGVWNSNGYTTNLSYGYLYIGSYTPEVYLSTSFFTDPVFRPSYDVVPLPFYSLEVDGFYEWIINNNKLSELPSYIVQSKLKSFIDFYKQFGSSNTFFISKIADWFSHMNIANQSISNISALKSSTDKLYREYLDYRSSNHAYWPGSTKIQERYTIDTKTNNNDTTLITDDSNDTPIISILRDILRGVIAISNNINEGVSNIISNLQELQFTVNVVNDGGISNFDLNPVLDKMDDIIDKLEADTVSVEIDQTIKDDTDDFFDDWNLEFSTALNNKFPVASQLRTFFTGFFERCGIDADSDGEVYQYYNPGVLTASSGSRSAGNSSESVIVSDFLGKFDNSDPTFLDDASFQGVPDLSVSVGGHSVSIIDFRVYAKYRDKIHFIISFVIWTLYLLHLYKALPSIIGQVADVAVKTSDL